MELPINISLLMGRGYDETVNMILKEPDNHLMNIVRISKICRVKLKFLCSSTFPITRRKWATNVIEHVFPEFFNLGDALYYKVKRGGRSGYPIALSSILSYEPIIKSVNAFNTYEDFRKKFDTYFIKEELIKKLWDGKSAQHGGKYMPSDFRPISSSGKEALRMFLNQFKGVDSTDISTYSERKWENSTTYTARGCCHGTGGRSTSRDITVSHQMGFNRVHYSSEYSGTGNGRYGIVVSKSRYLHLEDD